MTLPSLAERTFSNSRRTSLNDTPESHGTHVLISRQTSLKILIILTILRIVTILTMLTIVTTATMLTTLTIVRILTILTIPK